MAIRTLLLVALIGATIDSTTAATREQRVPVGPPGQHWVVDRAELAGNVKFESILGRDAIVLRANTHVVKTGLDFRDGTIEFDLAPLANGDFAAVTFRRQSFTNHENIYLRLRRSGEFMALQYAPRVNGSSTWQLYPEFTAETEWPRNAWTHVRLDIKGSAMDVFVGSKPAPLLRVPRLRNGTTGGEIGFWARVNDRPNEWAAAISNLTITNASSTTALSAATNAPLPFVWNWTVSSPRSSQGTITTLPPGIETTTPARSEESGLVNLNRLFNVQPSRSTVFARHVFTSDTARAVVAGIGYSDDVTVFVNGEPIYSGINGWESRSPGYASFVDARFESIVLRFRPGQNEVVLAVSDDQRFGWGFAMRIDDATGLKF